MPDKKYCDANVQQKASELEALLINSLQKKGHAEKEGIPGPIFRIVSA